MRLNYTFTYKTLDSCDKCINIAAQDLVVLLNFSVQFQILRYVILTEGLEVGKFLVYSFHLNQFFVSSSLHNFTVLYHDDFVGMLDG